MHHWVRKTMSAKETVISSDMMKEKMKQQG